MNSNAQRVAVENERIVLSRLMRRTQATVAGEIGVSEPTMSRLAGSVQNISKMLAACGLKIVDSRMKCFDPEYIRALKRLAKQELESDELPEHPPLDWNDE